jgi:hypothetical protein
MTQSVPASQLNDHELLKSLVERLDQLRGRDTAPQLGINYLRDFAHAFRVFGDTHYATKVDDTFLPFLVRSSAALDVDFCTKIRDAHHQQRYHIESIEHLCASADSAQVEDWRALDGRLDEFISSHRSVAHDLENEAFTLIPSLPEDEYGELDLVLSQYDRASLARDDLLQVHNVMDRLLKEAERATG